MKLLSIPLAIAALFALCPGARAQSMPDMTRSMDISAFGGYSYIRSDYDPAHSNGITAGVDVTRFFGQYAPALEFRASDGISPLLSQRFFGAGLRVGRTFHRYTPYVDVLGGITTLHYTPPPCPVCTGDRGFGLEFGGGLDYFLTHNIDAKADLQFGHYNYGYNYVLQPDGQNYTLSPTLFTIGITYHIPFRPKTRAGDYR